KVPMPLLVKRVGKERLYSEAVESHIGGWFWNAATRARVNPTAQPEYDYELPASENEDWQFSATVEVQPKPEPADWTKLEVATVALKEVKEHVLPPLDDELAQAASEFETLDELRGEIEGRLRGQIEDEIEGLFRAAAVDELVKASKVQVSGPLVELRTRELVNGLGRSLEARGLDADTYFRLTGQSSEQLAE